MTNKPTVLVCRDMRTVVEPARKYDPAADYFGQFRLCNNPISSIFNHIELDWLLGFAPYHRNQFANATHFDQIGHSAFDQNAAAQFAINRNIEQRKAPKVERKPESRAGGLRIDLEPQKAFLKTDLLLTPSMGTRLYLDRHSFMNNPAKIWAGLPKSTSKSHYDSYAENNASVSWTRFDDVMGASRRITADAAL